MARGDSSRESRRQVCRHGAWILPGTTWPRGRFSTRDPARSPRGWTPAEDGGGWSRQGTEGAWPLAAPVCTQRGLHRVHVLTTSDRRGLEDALLLFLWKRKTKNLK